MGPIFKFLNSLRSLAKTKNMTIKDAYKFAEQEFGEVSDLLKLQINKIFKDVKAPSIKKPSKPEGKVIEAVFKPGVDKRGKRVEESESQLMNRLEEGIKTLKVPQNLTTGLTRTMAREILMKRGIDLGKGMDPIEVFRSKFGEEILGDVANLADELVEMEAMGKTPKKLEEILKQEGLLDVKMPKEPPRGYSDEELAAIQKEIDQEDTLLKFDPKDREPNAVGGRVGKGSPKIFDQLEMDVPHPYGHRVQYALGSLPKGIQALVKQINKKFGKDTLKTADEMERPKAAKEKEMFEKFESRNPDRKRKLTDDEIKDYEEELGDSETWLNEGTVEEAEQALRRQKEYEADMFTQYKSGKLDPKPGEKGRKEFLESKLEEMEMSGDKKLMTVDEIEELSNMDLEAEMNVAKSLAPKMVERLELKQKYPGITDDLLDKILIDDNMQRKAEVLATLDEAFKMMEKGMGPDEVLSTIKNVTRTKQAGGGLAYLMGL
jgi:hypothetical protein